MSRRHAIRGRRRWLAVLGAALAAGCSTIFDTPSMEGVRSTIPEQILGDVAEQAKSQVPALDPIPGEVLTEAVPEQTRGAINVASEQAENYRDTLSRPTDGAGRARDAKPLRHPKLAIERTGDGTAQFVLEGVRSGVVRLNGEPIGLIQTQTSRVFMLAPGRHSVRVDYVGRPPLSADFFIDKGERIILRDAI